MSCDSAIYGTTTLCISIHVHVILVLEPLYSGHPWDSLSILIKRGVLISGVVFYVAGTVHGVLIKRDILIEGFH